MNRRDFLAGSGFTTSAFTTPVTRWLVTPANETADHAGEKQVGRADLVARWSRQPVTELASSSPRRTWSPVAWRRRPPHAGDADGGGPIHHHERAERIGGSFG
ncbi:hypothetical protein ACFQ51_44230 [Streptomyces kaempferi]